MRATSSARASTSTSTRARARARAPRGRARRASVARDDACGREPLPWRDGGDETRDGVRLGHASAFIGWEVYLDDDPETLVGVVADVAAMSAADEDEEEEEARTRTRTTADAKTKARKRSRADATRRR